MSKMPISFKKAAGKTSIKHNNRDFNEKDWKNDFHKHIDRDRTAENVVIKSMFEMLTTEFLGKL